MRRQRIRLAVGLFCGLVLSVGSWAWAVGDEAVQADRRAKLLAKHPEMDTNGDGKLSQDEWRAFVGAKGYKAGPGRESLKSELLKSHPELDKDHDGTLSDEEMRQGQEIIRQQFHLKMNERVLAEHREADTDGDGVLSDEEMLAFRKKIGGRDQGRIVSPTALFDRLMEQFDKADLDGNGQLSREELTKFRQKYAAEFETGSSKAVKSAQAGADNATAEVSAKQDPQIKSKESKVKPKGEKRAKPAKAVEAPSAAPGDAK